MELGVLGPLHLAHHDGSVLAVPGAQVRRVAALLALHHHPLPVDQLVDGLWPWRPPSSARKTVQGFVFRLRRLIGPATIQTTAAGYLLDRRLVSIDVDRFDHEIDLVLGEAPRTRAHNSTSDRVAQVATLERALSRWRGQPYDELDEWAPAVAERARLEERHHQAEEHLAELRLELQPDRAIDHLEALVATAPLRERRWLLLLDALMQAGRTAEALRAYERARRQLVDALGAEPGPALRARHAQALALTAARSAEAPAPLQRSALPRLRTRFIGRERDLAEVDRTLRDHVLVTIGGPGGSGKTRLAVELAHRWSNEADTSVAFADLTATSSAAQVAHTVAAAVLADPPGDLAVDELGALLRPALEGRDWLFVIDNAEHVVAAAAAAVDRLLQATSSLRILVTSRVTLGVEGERRWPLGPLDATAAEALYVDRAHARQPIVATSARTQRAIRDLCARLDNLPLAIELAAARADVLGPTQLLARLSAGQGLPRTPEGTRRPLGGIARWSSLDTAVRWSVDALPPAVRDAFLALSVLPDAFDLDTAAAVTGCDRELTLTMLSALVDASLVVSAVDHGRSANDAVAFRLLVTIRDHALRALQAVPGQWREAHDRLLAWAAGLADRYLRLIEEGNRHREAMATIDAHQHNLRAALDWSSTEGSIATGLRVMVRLEDWWRASGRTTEAWERASQLLAAADPAVDPAHRCHITLDDHLVAATWTAAFGVHLVDANPAVRQLVIDTDQQIASLEDPSSRLRLATQLRWLAWELDGDHGIDKLLALLEDSRRLGGVYEPTVLHFLTARYLQSGRHVEALETGRRCYEAALRNGNDVSRAHGAEMFGCALAANGDLVEARRHLRSALDGLLDADHLGCVLHCLDSVAGWAAVAGRGDDCRELIALIDGIRRDLRRLRHPLEQYGYLEAIHRYGPVEAGSGDELVERALNLCDTLLGPSAGALRDLSRPPTLRRRTPPADQAAAATLIAKSGPDASCR